MNPCFLFSIVSNTLFRCVRAAVICTSRSLKCKKCPVSRSGTFRYPGDISLRVSPVKHNAPSTDEAEITLYNLGVDKFISPSEKE